MKCIAKTPCTARMGCPIGMPPTRARATASLKRKAALATSSGKCPVIAKATSTASPKRTAARACSMSPAMKRQRWCARMSSTPTAGSRIGATARSTATALRPTAAGESLTRMARWTGRKMARSSVLPSRPGAPAIRSMSTSARTSGATPGVTSRWTLVLWSAKMASRIATACSIARMVSPIGSCPFNSPARARRRCARATMCSSTAAKTSTAAGASRKSTGTAPCFAAPMRSRAGLRHTPKTGRMTGLPSGRRSVLPHPKVVPATRCGSSSAPSLARSSAFPRATNAPWTAGRWATAGTSTVWRPA
mmetsp:Transcript_76299/g.182589  ORF Transcript_76299/g.182589 Transcript_76299/m.182589 type:complete len:306 (-) Transcript_76299:2593-3510(-)